MDIQMPVMDGLQATAAIKEPGPPAWDIPIVAMTAHALKEEEKRYRRHGMCGYVLKPFVPVRLYATLLEAVKAKPQLSHTVVPRYPLAPSAKSGYDRRSRPDKVTSALPLARCTLINLPRLPKTIRSFSRLC